MAPLRGCLFHLLFHWFVQFKICLFYNFHFVQMSSWFQGSQFAWPALLFALSAYTASNRHLSCAKTECTVVLAWQNLLDTIEYIFKITEENWSRWKFCFPQKANSNKWKRRNCCTEIFLMYYIFVSLNKCYRFVVLWKFKTFTNL